MFLDTRFANCPRWCISRPPDYDMRLPDHFRDSVVFLCQQAVENGVEYPRFVGTAFFVRVPNESDPDQGHLYLVTAKHVIDQIDKGGPTFDIRINTRDGGWQLVQSRPSDWWLHPNAADTTDVAVCPFSPFPRMKYNHVDARTFVSDEEIRGRRINPGDEVVIAGLFTKLRGQSKNLPLVRVGNVAMLPDEDELVPVRFGDQICDVEMYLIECRSIGGLSGSPVLVRESLHQNVPVVEAGKHRIAEISVPGAFYLLGLARGHWDIDMKYRNKMAIAAVDQRKNPDAVNLGIATVVPAKKILEVLKQPRMIERRQRSLAEAREKAAAENEIQSDEA